MMNQTSKVILKIALGAFLLFVACDSFNNRKIPFIDFTQATPPAPMSLGPPTATIRDQHVKATKLLADAGVAQEDALEQIEIWEREIEPLTSGEDGTAIAAHDDLVEKLAGVLIASRMKKNELRSAGEEINGIKNRVEAAMTSTTPELLTPTEMQLIGQLNRNVQKANSDWELAIKQARAILFTARKREEQASRVSGAPVETPTLIEKIEEIHAEETIEEMDNPSITQVPDDPVAVAPEFDPELRKQALSATVRGTLAPFLAPRTKHPIVRGFGITSFTNTFDKQPMSYGMIVGAGALEESIDGLRRLAALGSHPLPQPCWSYKRKPYNWTEDDKAFLRKAQGMLRDYGEILVAEGLLSP